MWSLTITIVLLLTATSSQGGLVRRSINDKPRPYTSGKDLLTMGGAGEAIRKSFELEELAKDLEKELAEISQVAAHINFTETEKMSEALALAKNIKSLIHDQRTELSGLAKNTISKSERILRKFNETVAGDRDLDGGMRSILRDMRNLLGFSEEKLKTVKENISILREKINKVLATLRVFKGLFRAAKKKDEALK